MFEKRIKEKLRQFNNHSKERFLDELTIDELTNFLESTLTRICKREEEIIFLTPKQYSEKIAEYDMQEQDEFIALPQLKGYLL